MVLVQFVALHADVALKRVPDVLASYTLLAVRNLLRAGQTLLRVISGKVGIRTDCTGQADKTLDSFVASKAVGNLVLTAQTG